MVNKTNQDIILNEIRAKFSIKASHGLKKTEIIEIKELINDVKPNDNEHKTTFPDFISTKGFIEHFHITSGKMSKKGYDVSKSESEYIDSLNEYMKITSSLPMEDGKIYLSQHQKAICRFDESLKNLHDSLKVCWESHIDKYHKYSEAKHISCFLISSDDVIGVYENPVDNNKIYYGNLSREFSIKYCFAYDTFVLDYIYKYHDEIDYVIYYNTLQNNIEVIKTSNIPQLKDYLSKQIYSLYPINTIISESTYGLHLPIISNES